MPRGCRPAWRSGRKGRDESASVNHRGRRTGSLPVSKTKAPRLMSLRALHEIIPGDDLLSHTLARAVPSALRGLTAVFGMGTGVSPSPESPENLSFKERWSGVPGNRIGFVI